MKFYNKDINTIAINALLDCGEITLTSIGALCCKLLPATIKNGVITPPRQIVEFHNKARVGVSSLTQLIAWSYSISLEEAEKVYHSWLENIKTQNITGTTYVIDGLGTICESTNSSTIFTTDKEFIQQLNPLTQEFTQESETQLDPSTTTPLESNKEITPNETDLMTKNHEFFWKNTAMIFIVVAILAIGVALSFYLKKPKEVIREIKIEKIITDTVYINESQTSSSPSTTIVATTPAAVVSNNATTNENKISNGKYHIIAGVFKSEDNAIKKVKALTKDGISPVMQYIPEREDYLVSVASFVSKSEAQAYLNKLGSASDDKLESHWIYRFVVVVQ